MRRRFDARIGGFLVPRAVYDEVRRRARVDDRTVPSFLRRHLIDTLFEREPLDIPDPHPETRRSEADR